MKMDNQTLFNMLNAAVSGMLGWILKTVWSEIKMLQENQKQIENHLHEQFVRKDDWKDSMNRIESMFQRIFDKLDNKEDKK